MELIPIYSKAPLNKDWQAFFKNSKQELRKQEAKEKENNNKNEKELDLKGLAEIIKEIIKILNTHTETLEALSEKIDSLAEVQSQRPYGRAPVEKREPSQRDLAILNSKIENLGLCGEIRKILPFQVIGGKIESP